MDYCYKGNRWCCVLGGKGRHCWGSGRVGYDWMTGKQEKKQGEEGWFYIMIVGIEVDINIITFWFSNGISIKSKALVYSKEF